MLWGNKMGGRVGGGVDYEHRVKKDLSLFGTGQVGHGWGNQGPGLYYEAQGGLRWRF